MKAKVNNEEENKIARSRRVEEAAALEAVQVVVVAVATVRRNEIGFVSFFPVRSLPVILGWY